MKNILLIICLILSFGSVKSQDLFGHDCGTWVLSSDTTYGWETVDTVSGNHIKTSERKWVEDEWRQRRSNSVNANYCPCGCGGGENYFQYRVCSITGIRQYRVRVVEYSYIPKPPTDYQKAIQKFQK